MHARPSRYSQLMSARPAVDRLVMFKHGVAYVSRSGPVDGDFGLTFRRDDMKDVLKSLAIDVTGGQASIGTVAFDSPKDPRTELANRNLLLEPGGALLGLVEALRGRMVEIRCGDTTHRGEVIGVDDSGEGRRTLVLRTAAGAVRLVELAQAEGIELAEEPSRTDLEYLMDRSRAATAGEDCHVAVTVTGHPEQARVSYIVPAPMWRVSYRVVRDGDAVTLAAFAIVHNPLDEDLTEVSLTLTTGQPISFDIDLYHERMVRRDVTQERARMFKGGVTRGGPPDADEAVPAPAAAAGQDPFASYADAASMIETSYRGEHFEYQLTTPVSIRRGGAAMVPLAVTRIDTVRRELVARDNERTPDIVLTFPNSTGAVLEEGPAVVYEQGGYAGEAMVDFTARNAQVRLAFAKDLAVRCRSTSRFQTVTANVRLTQNVLVEEQRAETRHTLRAENDHDEDVEVIFELVRVTDHRMEAVDTVAEIVDTARNYRVRVSVPAHQTVEATLLETWPIYSEVAYGDLSPTHLDQWLTGRSLDAATIEELSGVLQRWNQAWQFDGERERLEAERADDHAAQSRIAEQLRVLGSDGPEGELRRRQVQQLDQLQDRVDALDARIRALRDDAAAVRQAASDELQRLIDR